MRKRFGSAPVDLLFRAAEQFPHDDGEQPEPGFCEQAAELGRSELSAGEEKDFLSVADLPHRVTVHPVGGAESPVLPGFFQSRGQNLQTGNPRKNLPFVCFRQHRQQETRPGIEPAVSAEQDADLIAVD